MMEAKLFRIGEMAQLFHLSVSSIRHYERLGLLTPEYIDPATGYRYFSTRQFDRFNSIRYLRTLDMPLEEIADFLQNRDVDKIEEKLRVQQQVVAEKQRELARVQRKIENRLHQLNEAQAAVLGRIEEVQLPPCRLFWVDGELTIRDYHDMELPTIHLAHSQQEAVIFLGKVGVGITAGHLEAGEFSRYDGVFLTLDEEDSFAGTPLCLGAERGVRVRFRGSHPEAAAQYRALMEYLHRRCLRPSGFSREITVIDYGFTNDPDKFITEISIPVRSQES